MSTCLSTTATNIAIYTHMDAEKPHYSQEKTRSSERVLRTVADPPLPPSSPRPGHRACPRGASNDSSVISVNITRKSVQGGDSVMGSLKGEYEIRKPCKLAGWVAADMKLWRNCRNSCRTVTPRTFGSAASSSSSTSTAATTVQDGLMRHSNGHPAASRKHDSSPTLDGRRYRIRASSRSWPSAWRWASRSSAGSRTTAQRSTFLSPGATPQPSHQKSLAREYDHTAKGPALCRPMVSTQGMWLRVSNKKCPTSKNVEGFLWRAT